MTVSGIAGKFMVHHQSVCASCAKTRAEVPGNSWFLVMWAVGARYLCSRICLVRWISGDGRVEIFTGIEPGGPETAPPHRRE